MGISTSLFAMDDSDLTGGTPFQILTHIPLELHPDQIQTSDPKAPFELQIFRLNHGTLEHVVGLPIKISHLAANSVRLEAVLKNSHFEINHGSDPYKIVADVPSIGKSQLIFQSDSPGGQALGIWQIAHRAKNKLETEIGLGFWNSTLTFLWPEEADYYSFGQVHISRGDHWDVVGHEMGHAIYDMGGLGTFGGGMHKIDECYSEELALSEGWASFFSGWVSVDLNDADAKFEYMVPRRAPIRFETIPANVCLGERNEWRVTGFFWDLIDLHDDGEKSQESFARIWKALEGSQVSSTLAARTRLEQSGLDRFALQIVWDLNFGASSPSSL